MTIPGSYTACSRIGAVAFWKQSEFYHPFTWDDTRGKRGQIYFLKTTNPNPIEDKIRK